MMGKDLLLYMKTQSENLYCTHHSGHMQTLWLKFRIPDISGIRFQYSVGLGFLGHCVTYAKRGSSF